jgi:Tfp pilus assembly protein PilX
MEQLTRSRLAARPSRQHGMVLFFSLIMLVALTIAAMALVRSVDTANLVTGNIAFKQASVQMADIGVEAAVAALPGIIAASADANSPAGCASNCTYYALRQNTDAKGVPTTTDWTAVPTVTGIALPSGYSVRYVIERLCEGPTPVTDIVGNCFSEGSLSGSSKRAGAPKFSGASTIFYRVTVRVAGPRATETFAQAVLSR